MAGELLMRRLAPLFALLLLSACVQPVTTPTATPRQLVVIPSATPQAQGVATAPLPALATPLPTAVIPGGATAVAANGQLITIETPAVGTIVGSPVTITGRATRDPASGQLSFAVRDAKGIAIGGGSFPTVPSTAGATFVASIVFNAPPNGGQIFVEIADPGRATTSIQLMVAPPQAIIFESPAPGTQVGSPMTITGRTARYPFQGALSYKVFDSSNRQLGDGLVPVQGQPGSPGTFVAEVRFNLLPAGGDIRVEVTDVDAVSGAIAAKQALLVKVAAQPNPTSVSSPTPLPSQTPLAATATAQPSSLQITLDSPVAASQVHNPFPVSGRVSVVPASGQLRYRVRDANGKIVGEGLIPVTGTAGQPATFNGLIGFILQQNSLIVLEIGDTDPAGNLRTSAIIVLNAVV